MIKLLRAAAAIALVLSSGCGTTHPSLSPACADLAAAALKEQGKVVLWCKE